MKKTISSLVIASTILTGSAFAPIVTEQASAKTVQAKATAQLKVLKEAVTVDGKAVQVSYITLNNTKLYSIEQLSKLVSASYKYDSKAKKYVVSKNINKKVKKLEFQANSATLAINGKNTKIAKTVLVGKTLYVDAAAVVKNFGGDFLPLGKGSFLATTGLVSGDTFDPQWVNNSTVLVTNDNGKAAKTLLLSTSTKKSVHAINATELVVSPDGSKAIFSDEEGFTYLADLTAKSVTKIGTDDSIKTEFVWAQDGQTVYFLQNDKADKVASINVADGTVKTIFSDSLSYKSDLKLSVDGKKLLYIVAKEGKTTNTTGDNPEVDNIDVTGTEPQIYVIDLTAEKPAATAITTSTDEKVFPGFLANGDVAYLSSVVDSTNPPEIKVVKADKTVSTLVSGKNIISSVVSQQGNLYVLVAEASGYSAIYKVDATTTQLTKIAATKLALTSFSVSTDETSIAAVTAGSTGGKVVILNNGVFESLTK